MISAGDNSDMSPPPQPSVVIAGETLITADASIAGTPLDGLQTIMTPDDGLKVTQGNPTPPVPGADGNQLQMTVETPGALLNSL